MALGNKNNPFYVVAEALDTLLTTLLSRWPAALGQTTKSGSLPVTLASDQGALASYDAGPSQAITRTHTSIADASSTTSVTAAPSAGQKITVLDYIISVDTACLLTIEMETSGNDLAAHYMSANSTIQITPRGYIKGDAADKKIHVKTSVAAAVKATLIYTSEA